ncbi:MAG TPA: hypothetical protein PKC30_12340 [Saprospiraceae bacterium]|nr:hypothetical protein [Saprospiraceae bacterium]
MEKQERIDSILRMMRTKLEDYIDEESNITDPIEYENRLLEIGNNFALEVLQTSPGKMSKSIN